METIIRKSMLYKTGVEYGDYTMNHVLGCAHGCKYPCYAFLMAKRFGKTHSYEEWTTPKLVSNTIELLQQEIPKLKDKITSVQLCFTSDPFMIGYPEVEQMSIEAIKLLNSFDIQCNILTKGILPNTLTSLSKKNEYGITLVSLDEDYRKIYEPFTSQYYERINALKELSFAGCKTWVSIEPYPTPNIIEQNLGELLESIKFVDKIIFGRTHYNKDISAYKKFKDFYNLKAQEVISFCKKNDIQYHIKKGTITS